MTRQLRPTLGDFNSIVCFRALVTGMEETLGVKGATVALKAAGRKRGKQLVDSLGLTGKAPEKISDTAALLNAALGADGTRLCIVDKMERHGDTIQLFLRDTVCSADEPEGSTRELSFTAGAMHGALEAIYGERYFSQQVGSILRGQDHDIMEFTPR